jgi:hypothetical protein
VSKPRHTLFQEGTIAQIRTAPVHAIVQFVGRVRDIQELPFSTLFGRRWVALLVDETGEVSVFGFESPPPTGALLAIKGDVGGFVESAVRDPEFAKSVKKERGWGPDTVEIGVDGWRILELPAAHES